MATPLSQTEADLAVTANPYLERLTEQHFGFVWRLLRRVGVPQADADGVAQRTFFALYQRSREIRSGSERSFLFSTALHIASRMRQVPVKSPASSSPELVLLDTLLAEMSLELRVVLVLFEIECLTCAQIAEVVGVPTYTVSARLRLAREDFSASVARIEARRALEGSSDV